MSLTPQILWQSMTHPAWALAAVQNGGKFRFKNLEPYYDAGSFDNVTQFIGSQLNGSLDWDYLNEIRAAWDGPLILKGILNGQDATRAVAAGVDGLIVSNHGGRQLDAVPASIDLLEAIRSSVGPKVPLLFDSGVRSGLDVARALAAGADFVMCGRAFMFGVAALGEAGADHVLAVLKDELENTMVQLGLERLADLPTALSRPS
jgi:L-lactate dehydrogenase (cytochrome)